ncbi:MFS transporter [Kitasatospora sp. LaBMicrA B282]|uniref:MFS transporter n=1 Tax=Kitasatospora sp. LaBMicrA B282 TaxID=3420949 RepID=UPI003D0C916B
MTSMTSRSVGAPAAVGAPACPSTTVPGAATTAAAPAPVAPVAPAPVAPTPPATGVLARFRGFGEPLWVVLGGTAMNRIGNLVLPFLVFFLGARHLPTDRIPLVLGALGAGGLVGPVLGGTLTDRFGSRLTMVTGMLGTATAQGLLYAAHGLPALTLAALALGTVGSLHFPAVSAVVAQEAGPQRRRVAFGLFHWSINVGTAVAGSIGGFLAEHGYGLLFALDAGTCLGYAAVVALRLPRDAGRPAPRATAADPAPESAAAAPSPAAAAPAPAAASAPSGYRAVLRDRLLLTLLGPIILGEAVYAQSEFTLPLAIRDHGLPPTVFGLAAAVNAALVVSLQPFATALLARVDRVRLWAVSSALVTAGLALTGVAGTPTAFVLTVVVWSLGEVCASGLYASVVADLAPAGMQGRYSGTSGWARGLARFAALVLGSAVYANLGAAALWWACAVLGLTGAAVTALLSRTVRLRTATA